jgi:hypothetical protein
MSCSQLLEQEWIEYYEKSRKILSLKGVNRVISSGRE